MTPEELQTTSKAIREFVQGPGPALHATLKERDAAAPDNSYINDYWKAMYLREMRDPLPINVNPFLQLVDDKRTVHPLVRAASLVASSVRFVQALRAETLEPDIYHMGTIAQKPLFKSLVTLLPKKLAYPAAYLAKSYPLDMSQYPWLFGTSRQAKAGGDVLFTNPDSRHIAVLCNNNVFSLDVLSPEGEPISQDPLSVLFFGWSNSQKSTLWVLAR